MEKGDGQAAVACPLPAQGSCQQMAGKIEALMATQQECQRWLEMLGEEQEAFLKDMRSFMDAQAGVQPSHTAVGTAAADPAAHGIGSAPLLESTGTQQMLPHRETARERFKRPTRTFESSTHSDSDDEEPCSADRITMTTLHLKKQLTGLFHEGGRGSLVEETIGFFANVKAAIGRALQSKLFEPAMGAVILVNAANIGWTIEMELHNQDTHVQTIIEIAILGIFWAELALLFIVKGIRALKEAWHLFDFLLNLVTTVVLVLASLKDVEESAGSFAETMKQMLILRMLRLLRLFRAVRLIKMSRSLWKLVEGLKQCLGTMVAALSLISVILYVFGCIGAEMVTKAYVGDDQVGGLIESNFSSLPRIMLTLFQFIAMDSTASIYVKLVHRSPFLFIYFLVLVVLVTIMLMNLITAVVVEDAITTATMDNDMKRHFLREKLRKLRPAFQSLFRDLDPTSEGTLVIEDIVTAIHSGLVIPPPIQDLVTPSRMLDLFDLLDQDQSGELNEAEFVDGLSCLALSEVPLETMQILHLLRCVRREVLRLHRAGRCTEKSSAFMLRPTGMACSPASALRRTASALRRASSAAEDSTTPNRSRTVNWDIEEVDQDHTPAPAGLGGPKADTAAHADSGGPASKHDALEDWEGFDIEDEHGDLTL